MFEALVETPYGQEAYERCGVCGLPSSTLSLTRLCGFVLLFVMPDRRRMLVPGFDTLTRGDRYGGRTHPGASRR